MLVLARKVGESIMIGDRIELTILETDGDKVRIGIQAPRDVGVYRKEIYLAIKDSNREAAESVWHPERLSDLLKNGE